MALLSVNSSFGLRVLTERDGNLTETPRYARLQGKHSLGFILRQHVHLAASPSPPRHSPPPALRPGHAHPGLQHDGTRTAVIQRPDSLEGQTGVPPSRGSPRARLPPCPEGGPGGGQLALRARSPSPLFATSLGVLAPFCLPPSRQSRGATGAAGGRWPGKETKEDVGG